MKERPILFSGEMVRAILADKKTMTRRVVKPYGIAYPGDRWTVGAHPRGGWFAVDIPEWKTDEKLLSASGGFPCPYGVPGDRLWVREAFSPDWCDHVIYRADDPTGGGARDAGYASEPKWKPSIHMKREYSRIDLELVTVRVERVQDISDKDIVAEGIYIPVNADSIKDGKGHPLIRLTGKNPPIKYLRKRDGDPWTESELLRAHFAALWDDINAKRGYSWKANPWVWVVEFRKIGGVDQA